MSKQNINDFIRNNRSAFDDDLPPVDGWQKLDQAISRKKKARVFSMRDIMKWSAVAAVIIIGFTSMYLLLWRKQDNRIEPKITRSMEMNDGSASYVSETSKIIQSIQEQQSQLKELANEQPQLYQQFSDDMAALDSSYRVLRTQAAQTTNREIILQAMLQNLRLQAELLTKQLSIIHEYSTPKNKTNDKSSYRGI